MGRGRVPQLGTCLAEQDAAIERCRQRDAARSNKLRQCTDQAQLTGFQCRNGVRRTLWPQLAACRRAVTLGFVF